MKVYDFIKDGAMSKAHGNVLRGGQKNGQYADWSPTDYIFQARHAETG